MADALATELRCEVAEHLWRDADTSSLRSLSLASKDWTGPTQSLLFRHLLVRLTATTTISDLALFFHTSPHLGRYVFELLLLGTKSRPVEFHAPQLFACIPLLPSLQHLRVYSANFLESATTPQIAARPINLTLINVHIWASDLFLLIEQCSGPTLCLADVIALSFTQAGSTMPPCAIGSKRQSLTLHQFVIQGPDLGFAPDVLVLCPDSINT